jgi:RNA polymerase I specific transcription initiation factor
MEDIEERRQKKARLVEVREYDKILLTLDHQDQRDLAAHLLLAAQYKKNQGVSRRTKNGKSKQSGNTMVIQDSWTAWPLPSDIVCRPTPIPSSSMRSDNSSNALHTEIEATILRTARSRIQAEDPSKVSADEHPPYHITREVTNSVISKFDSLLHSLGRIKHQQLKSKRSKLRAAKSKWDEIVGIAGISECIDSEETMKHITERCNKLFGEDISWEIEQK